MMQTKNPKRSVRERYNRRKLRVSEALLELDMAAEEVLKQSGPIHKREEAESIRDAIADFRELTGLRPPGIGNNTLPRHPACSQC